MSTVVLSSLPASLTDDDKLSLLLGRIARDHARLNHTLSYLWRELVESPAASLLAPDNVDLLIKDCKKLIVESARFTSEQQAMAVDALSVAGLANTARNNLLHQRWWTHEDRDRWTTEKLPNRKSAVESRFERTLADVADVAQDVYMADLRVYMVGEFLTSRGDWVWRFVAGDCAISSYWSLPMDEVISVGPQPTETLLYRMRDDIENDRRRA